MKELYIECNMGASGDMLMGALFDICPDPSLFLKTMDLLGLPGVRVIPGRNEKMGVAGVSMTVTVDGREESCGAPCPELTGPEPTPHQHGHDHSHVHARCPGPLDGSLASIRTFIEGADLNSEIKAGALAVYELLAMAESAAHGTPPGDIHFCEVGTLDALADIIGCCVLMDMIGPDRITCSPVHVGYGQVRCSHGVLPVPAPATAHILRGIPIYGGEIRGELCTPTGAALLRHFASEFGPMPPMRLQAVGCGLGKKDFPAANCLRVLWGETGGSVVRIAELRCNIDDMTGEALGAAMDSLLDSGALDVYFTPIQMKKNRPAVMLTCLCVPERMQSVAEQMLAATTTLGVRGTLCDRTVLSWETVETHTPYGTIRVKKSSGYGVHKVKPEFDDVRAVALRHGIPIDTVQQAALKESAPINKG